MYSLYSLMTAGGGASAAAAAAAAACLAVEDASAAAAAEAPVDDPLRCKDGVGVEAALLRLLLDLDVLVEPLAAEAPDELALVLEPGAAADEEYLEEDAAAAADDEAALGTGAAADDDPPPAAAVNWLARFCTSLRMTEMLR